MKCPPEYEKPQSFIVCSPSEKALSTVDSANHHALLFREPNVRVRDFRLEHTALARALRSIGCTVIDVADLSLPAHMEELWNSSPNTVFTRDSGFTLPDGGVVLRMATQERSREPELMEYVYRALDIPIIARANSAARVEGGDIIFVSPQRVMIGYGPRTSLAGVRFLRDLLILQLQCVQEIVAFSISPERINLDGVLMPLDSRVLLVDASALQPMALILGRHSETLVPISQVLCDYDVVDVPRSEGYMLSTNIVHAADHTVVAYAHNSRTNSELAARGFKVVPVEGNELVKGSGGPRCMTQAVRYSGLL